jgi:hypothetical protein
MGIEEIYDIVTEPTNMEKTAFINIPKYVMQTGGGIYWLLCYTVLYAVFIYEVLAVQEHINYMLFGVVGFGVIYIFLILGIRYHIKYLNNLKSYLQNWMDEKEKDCHDRVNKVVGESNATTL